MKKTFLLIFILFLFVNIGYARAVTKTSSKKGVGGMDPTSEQNIKNLGIQWSYNWYPNVVAFNQNLYEHVPMITAAMKKSNQLNYNVIRNIATNHQGSYWLIFNEPDFQSTDNISATTGAQWFKEFYDVIHAVDPLAKFIVGGIYGNLTWMTDFVSEYKRLNNGAFPPVTGWHGHIYFGRTDYNINEWRYRLNAYKNWMDTPANGGRKEFWLTEWGCLNSTTVAKQIMIDQTPYLENLDWVTRYAWYNYYIDPNDQIYCPGCTGSLTNPDGTLNDLGNTYATFGSVPYITPTRIPTPTISASCICQTSGRCHSSCPLPTLTGGTTYSCSLSSAVSFATAPSAANKNAWCRRASRDTGDADGNGVVNNLDYMYYVRAVNGGTLPPPATLNVNPDINGDGVISPEDRAIIVSHM